VLLGHHAVARGRGAGIPARTSKQVVAWCYV